MARSISLTAKLCALIVLVVGALLSGPAGFGPPQNAEAGLALTILNPTPASGDEFGFSVARAGGNVLVGAPHDDTGATDAGAAYLFDGSTGALLQTFLNPTPAFNDQFGSQVGGVGGNVVVGARFDDTGAINSGAAYLFDSSTGALLQTFLNPTPGIGAQFGRNMADVGGNVLLGARFDDTGATDAGIAYLFDSSTGALLQTFLNPTPAAGDIFGVSVASVGGKVLIGANRDDTVGVDAGAAYLFDSGTGALLQTFLNPTPAVNDGFGVYVSGVGGNVGISAHRDDAGATDAGAAYLFDSSTGALLQTFLNPTPAVGDLFGFSMDGVGSNVLVGAPLDDTGSTDAGAAYLFDGNTGALLETFLNPSPAVGDRFGRYVADLGGRALMGADRDDTAATDAGAVYVFDIGPVDSDGDGVPDDDDACPGTPAGEAVDANGCTPTQAIENLLAAIDGFGLPSPGVTTSLTASLNQATANLNDGNPSNDGAVCGKLTAFINTVDAKEGNGQLTATEANELRQAAETIKASLGCS